VSPVEQAIASRHKRPRRKEIKEMKVGKRGGGDENGGRRKEEGGQGTKGKGGWKKEKGGPKKGQLGKIWGRGDSVRGAIA